MKKKDEEKREKVKDKRVYKKYIQVLYINRERRKKKKYY